MIIFAVGRLTNIMAIKEYSNDNPVTMASEPGVAYVSSVSTPLKTINDIPQPQMGVCVPY